MKRLIVLGLALSLSGCATLLTGSNRTVEFKSNQPNTRVSVDGNEVGETPLKTDLAANKEHIVKFEKAGFKPKTMTINQSISGGWVVVDVLFGVFPVVIDACTGKWKSIDGDSFEASMLKNDSTASR